MALITAAEVRARSAPDLSANSDTTTKLTTLITAADGMIAAFCGYPRPSATAARTMESASYTLYSGRGWLWVDGDDARRLVIGLRPVTAITSIHESQEEQFNAAALVAGSDYSQRGEHGQIAYLSQTSAHGQWTKQPDRIKAVITAGYSSAPATLKHAAAELVMFLWEQRARRAKSAITQGNLNTTYRSEQIPDHVAQMLGEYLLPQSVA